MPDEPGSNKSFFLTRQIANLMEDFARETSRSSSVFLLYGDLSVGKSRLLDELARRQFSGHAIHRLDFETDKYPIDGEDEAAEDSAIESGGGIQKLMQDASNGDIIILDHLESASNKARHQIFQNWAMDGQDKNLNLIVAADSGHFDEVRQLARQYQASVKSFKLKPFNWQEIEAFVSFYLYPEQSSDRLSIPADIQKQFKHSMGLVGKVIEIVSRENVSSAIKLDDKATTYKKPLTIAAILSVILLVASFLYPLSDQQHELPTKTGEIDSTESVEVKPEPSAIVKQQPAPMESVGDQPVLEPGEEPVQAEASLETPEPTAELVIESEQEFTIDHQDEDEVKPVELIPEIEEEVIEKPAQKGDQQLTRFQQELNKSLNWIENSDKDRGTIQIMSIGFDGFSDSTYYDYLDKLIQQDIDVSRVRIFQTRTKDIVVYSVTFGEYENRRDANKSIQLLPEALKANKPIPRTIGGIWDEISHLETSDQS